MSHIGSFLSIVAWYNVEEFPDKRLMTNQQRNIPSKQKLVEFLLHPWILNFLENCDFCQLCRKMLRQKSIPQGTLKTDFRVNIRSTFFSKSVQKETLWARGYDILQEFIKMMDTFSILKLKQWYQRIQSVHFFYVMLDQELTIFL